MIKKVVDFAIGDKIPRGAFHLTIPFGYGSSNDVVSNFAALKVFEKSLGNVLHSNILPNSSHFTFVQPTSKYPRRMDPFGACESLDNTAERASEYLSSPMHAAIQLSHPAFYTPCLHNIDAKSTAYACQQLSATLHNGVLYGKRGEVIQLPYYRNPSLHRIKDVINSQDSVRERFIQNYTRSLDIFQKTIPSNYFPFTVSFDQPLDTTELISLLVLERLLGQVSCFEEGGPRPKNSALLCQFLTPSIVNSLGFKVMIDGCSNVLCGLIFETVNPSFVPDIKKFCDIIEREITENHVEMGKNALKMSVLEKSENFIDDCMNRGFYNLILPPSFDLLACIDSSVTLNSVKNMFLLFKEKLDDLE
ncbi:hypothetical protein PCE1_003061 [Barthelona sp. PCE]